LAGSGPAADDLGEIAPSRPPPHQPGEPQQYEMAQRIVAVTDACVSHPPFAP
jgi:hypothetical protein